MPQKQLFTQGFWKEVIRPGTYFPAGKESVTVPKERIDNWHKQLQLMRKRKILVPVPYEHSDEATPVSSEVGNTNVKNNAAYVEDSRINDSGGLECFFNPSTEEDAANFNTKIKDVSIRTLDSFVMVKATSMKIRSFTSRPAITRWWQAKAI